MARGAAPRSPGDRALAARIGALRLHATHDPRATTARAREAFLGSFEREVDPDRVLPAAERARRAACARRAHFAQLARLSARKRRARGPER